MLTAAWLSSRACAGRLAFFAGCFARRLCLRLGRFAGGGFFVGLFAFRLRRGLPAAQGGFDLVAVEIDHESAVIVRAVIGPRTGRAVTHRHARALREEVVHGSLLVRDEADMRAVAEEGAF